MYTRREERKNIRIIDPGCELSDYLSALREKGVNRLAVDLEGDQGSINYKYSVSIIQCFDGVEPVIIDVLKSPASPVLRELLTCDDIQKVMFSAANDLFMTQNVLGCTISPLRDIAAAQKLLGMKIDLAGYIGLDRGMKNSFQRANWLKRPLSDELVNYAVNDVVWLLKIEEELVSALREKGLYVKYQEVNSGLSSKNFRVDQFLLYREKFPGYRRMSSEKKEKSRLLWIFREMIGEHFNCPVGYLLTKQAMSDIVQHNGDMLADIYNELNRNRRSRKKIDPDTVARFFDKAKEYSAKHRP